MKVFVTGGAGYIGSHTCKELARQGHEVYVYDNLCTGHRGFVQWGDFFYGDIRDTQNLRTCLKEIGPDGIIHFAASAYVGESVVRPEKYFSNNVTGTLSLLEAMKSENIQHIIVSSTCAVYGQPECFPISENTPTKPINPYGASKLFMERMLADFSKAYDIRYTSLRYFNAAGCSADKEIGELHTPETHLIPRILMAGLGKLEALDVFGNDYPTPDGTCIRDYVHVCDLARAHISALERLIQGGDSRIFNLGTGSGFSILEIIDASEKILGRKIKYSVQKRREGDPAILVSDNRHAKKHLNWTPFESTLHHILQTHIDWISNQKQEKIPS